jgi:hypothetical protein
MRSRVFTALFALRKRQSPGSLLLILELPAIMLRAQGVEVVDLARMIQVMFDHHRDDPTCFLQLTPVGHARAKQLGIIQGGDTLPESLLAYSQPCKSLRNGREHPTTIDQGIIPGELRIVEGMVLVHELAPTNVPNDVADRALSSRRNPEPILGRNGGEVAQQRVPFRALERLIEEVDEL